ncbi:hypothetical protein ACFVH4_17505 [Nocardia ignorata]|uniref:hypothetical protein n=1 Tax=Nocardia ignorata TaxID=145285 RepID=UPI00362CD0B7
MLFPLNNELSCSIPVVIEVPSELSPVPIDWAIDSAEPVDPEVRLDNSPATELNVDSPLETVDSKLLRSVDESSSGSSVVVVFFNSAVSVFVSSSVFVLGFPPVDALSSEVTDFLPEE